MPTMMTSKIVQFLSARRIVQGCVALLLLASALLATAPSAAQPSGSTPQSEHAIYLPLTIGRPGQAPEPPPPPPDPQWGGFFVEPEKKTSRPGVAVDPQGGMHMAYRYHVRLAEHPQVVYAYCPPPAAQCVDPAKWGRVAFLDRAEEVQIELTPAGKPRLLVATSEANTMNTLFVYAECDASCLNEASWSAIGVQTRSDSVGQAFEYYTPKRYFELDPLGRPRFVYYDYNYSIEPDHLGGFYLWCDADCTEPGTWNEALFTRQAPYRHESLSEPVLKFTRDGRPRILSYLSPLENGMPGTELRFEVYYIGCDSGCESSDGWERVALVARGSGYQPAWDLELDPATDSPRAVNYQSGERKLFYHTCDADCFSKSGWQTLDLSPGESWGVGVDLELDSLGRARMVMLGGSRGLGALLCDSNCGAEASWRGELIESGDEIDKAYPVARPITCNNGLWDTYSPTLVIDAQNNTHVIYDASYKARCQYVDPTKPAPPTDVFHEIWHSVRYVALR